MTTIIVTDTPDGPVETPITDLTDEQLARWAALGNEDATHEQFARFTRSQQVQKRHVPGEPYRYRHGWVPVAETLHEIGRDYHHNHVAGSVRADGSISLHVGESELQLQVEDVPDLVDAIDTHLQAHETGEDDHEGFVPVSSGDELQITNPRSGRMEIQFQARDGDLDAIALTPDEAEQFTADLEELADHYQPQPVDSERLAPDLALDLYSHDRVGLRPADTDTPDVILARGETGDVAAALAALAERYGRQEPEVDEDGRPLPVDERDITGGLVVRWYSDNSAGIGRGDAEVLLPAGRIHAAVRGLNEVTQRLVPQLTPKGIRLVRLLAKQANIAKLREGTPAGQYRARHLRRWFERGEGGARIGWGTPGDFARCVAIAGKYMAGPEGYCNLRHKGALGYYPATHAAMERGKKK